MLTHESSCFRTVCVRLGAVHSEVAAVPLLTFMSRDR